MNELLWLGFVVLDMALVVLVLRFFGKSGLFALVVFNLILCNIQVLKLVSLFGFNTTLGNVLYASVFLSANLLVEFYGRQAANKALVLGFCTLLMATAYMQISLLFIPAADDFAQPHLQAIFDFLPRLALASLCAYAVSQVVNVRIFAWLKRKNQERRLWLRNLSSSLIGQVLDSLVFVAIAFVNVFSWEVLLQIFITTFAIKALVILLDTPFFYLARYMLRHWPPPDLKEKQTASV